MKTTRVQVGIAGLGLVSSAHYKGYATHPAAQVVAVCDQDRARAEWFARQFGISEVYTSYEEMLVKADINTVDIATPTYLHIPMALQAVQAGKHVHCEKPFCRYTGEGLEACQAARQAGVKLVVGETYVFISSHVKARELIEAGEIGRPLQIRERHGAWLEREKPAIDTGPKDRGWRIDPEKSGGGDYPWIFDHAGHFFATAEYFLPGQRIQEVYAPMATSRGLKKSGAAHDPYQTAQVDIPIITWRYEDPDCQGLWVRAERLNGKWDYMRGFSTSVIGERGMIEVLGEGGHNLFWEGKQQHLILHREGKEAVYFRFDEGGDDVWQSDISYYSQGHIRHVHHLIDCILQDREPRYGAAEGVQAVRCTLAAIRSARERRPVCVDEVAPDFKAYS
jgi:predicted dehydrogenase